MMSNEKVVVHGMECKCLSWRPIVAGALIAIGFSFLLNLFSVAIGLTAFTTDSDGVEKLALSGLAATGLGVIVSMFAAGWLTGYLGQRHCFKRHLGALYGFLAWCIALIVTVFLASHVQEYLTFYGHFLSGTTSVVAASNPAGNVAVAAGVQTKSLVVSTYIIFVLFFLSAFAMALGGHCGMRHVCKKEGTCKM